jgi:ankyrin repeat protein
VKRRSTPRSTSARASTATATPSTAPNKNTGLAIVKLLLDKGADPNMQLFFKPANVRGLLHTRGATPLIRAAFNNDAEVVKLLLEKGADADHRDGRPADADPRRARRARARAAGRRADQAAAEGRHRRQHVALINHGEEIRGGTALHYAVRKRYKDVIKLLASYKIDLEAVDQDGLTALDYTQSRGFMPFMACRRRSSRTKRRCCASWAPRSCWQRTPCGRCSVRRRACGRTSGRWASREYMIPSTTANPTDTWLQALRPASRPEETSFELEPPRSVACCFHASRARRRASRRPISAV